MSDEILRIAKKGNAAIVALIVTDGGATGIQAVHDCHLPFKLENTPNGLGLIIDKRKVTNTSTEDVANFLNSVADFLSKLDESGVKVALVYNNYQIDQIIKHKVHEKTDKVDGYCFECKKETTGIVRLGTADGEVRASLCADCAERIGFSPDLLEGETGGSCRCDDVCQGQGLYPEGEKGLHGETDIHGSSSHKPASRPTINPSNN